MSGKTTNLTGGCACGRIRYKLKNDPLIVHACHCRDCQRITGSAFVINIWIESKFVERDGDKPKSFMLKGGTGNNPKQAAVGAAAHGRARLQNLLPVSQDLVGGKQSASDP